MKLCFLTSTPLDVVRGSGTFTGIRTLLRALEALGTEVALRSPAARLPFYTLERLWFNQQLRWRPPEACDAVVGFDMDGYRIAGRTGLPHVASIKGVIADEMRFERGWTRRTMAVQAACEAAHARRASLVMTTSRYAARRLETLYGIPEVKTIIPELIDLAGWRQLFQQAPAEPDPRAFTVFSVCRFYPRKRLELLVEAAGMLRGGVPGLQVRIAGGGPEAERLRALSRGGNLEGVLRWLGDLTLVELAREYNGCDVFCLPSVQEGFGIVFLEAMAAGKPIVAARAAAVPEVLPQGLLVEPESAESLAEGLRSLYQEPERRASLAAAGLARVEQYDAPRVAKMFLEAMPRG